MWGGVFSSGVSVVPGWFSLKVFCSLGLVVITVICDFLKISAISTLKWHITCVIYILTDGKQDL